MFENDDNLNHKPDSDSDYDSFFDSLTTEEQKQHITISAEQIDENVVEDFDETLVKDTKKRLLFSWLIGIGSFLFPIFGFIAAFFFSGMYRSRDFKHACILGSCIGIGFSIVLITFLGAFSSLKLIRWYSSGGRSLPW